MLQHLLAHTCAHACKMTLNQGAQQSTRERRHLHLVHPGSREEDANFLRVLLQLPVLLVAELQVALVLSVGAAPGVRGDVGPVQGQPVELVLQLALLELGAVGAAVLSEQTARDTVRLQHRWRHRGDVEARAARGKLGFANKERKELKRKKETNDATVNFWSSTVFQLPLQVKKSTDSFQFHHERSQRPGNFNPENVVCCYVNNGTSKCVDFFVSFVIFNRSKCLSSNHKNTVFRVLVLLFFLLVRNKEVNQTDEILRCWTCGCQAAARGERTGQVRSETSRGGTAALLPQPLPS